MNKRELVLLALYSTGNKCLTPVQIQKLVFLIEKNLPSLKGKPVFNFQPYNYGPFDKEVYSTLDDLAEAEMVEISRSGRWPTYKILNSGRDYIDEMHSCLDDKERSYIASLGEFVTSLSFSELVTAIYQAYPSMRKNSVFQGG